MLLGNVLAYTYSQVGLDDVGLHHHVDVAILVGSEDVVAEFESDGAEVGVKGSVIVRHLVVGIVEEIKGAFVGVAEVEKVLATEVQAGSEMELSLVKR